MPDKSNTFVLSDETVNSYGFTIKTSGIKIERFKKNPVMLYQHDEALHPIGKWENIRLQGTQLVADAVFDRNDPLGNMVADKVEQGFLNATSVTVVPLSGIYPSIGDIVDSSELIEASIVTIPSNPNAVRLSANMPGINGKKSTCYFNIKLAAGTTLQNRLIELLQLDKSSTDDEIYTGVENLKKQVDQVKQSQDSESESLVELAIKYEIIPPTLKKVQLMAFKHNFFESKEELQALIDKKVESIRLGAIHSTLREVILGTKGNNINLNVEKPKHDWTLDDYRKYAPLELSNNPELYKRLVNEKFKEN